MKTITEFNGFSLMAACSFYEGLKKEGKTPEDIQTEFGEKYKVEGTRLTLMLCAVKEHVGRDLSRVKRVVCAQAGEGEKIPVHYKTCVDVEGHYMLVEMFATVSHDETALRRDAKGGRGGRNDKRGGRPGNDRDSGRGQRPEGGFTRRPPRDPNAPVGNTSPLIAKRDPNAPARPARTPRFNKERAANADGAPMGATQRPPRRERPVREPRGPMLPEPGTKKTFKLLLPGQTDAIVIETIEPARASAPAAEAPAVSSEN